jgi:hypothetical protein
MVIEHIFKAIRLILNKDRRGFVKNSQIDTAVRMAIYDFVNDYVKIYSETGVISSEIKRLLKTSSLTLASGSATLPTDFIKEVNFVTNDGFEGDFVTAEEYQDRESSYILKPDETEPIGLIKDNKVFTSPNSLHSIEFTYIKSPVEFVYVTNDEGATALPDLSKTLYKMKRKLSRAEVSLVAKRLDSLGMNLPIPKGMDPTKLGKMRRG